MMRINTVLQCWLCLKPFKLALNLLDGALLGSPRFWCSVCTSRPGVFARLLGRRLAELQIEADRVQFPDETEAALVQQILASQVAVVVTSSF
jgi:hypothetical protein